MHPVKAGVRARRDSSANFGRGDPTWYRDAVIYEVHVRAFYDSNGDGTGDFPGLTEKLDYLRDLGVTAIWVLPFYPSPLRDDGYDIADYVGVNPAYGTLRDVETFIREAHRRGLRVITELVCNHTSDQHPWFQRARHAKPGSPWRDFYVWSDTPDRYPDARVIFKDFETSNWMWDPVAGAYYWHRFYSHQPDLNFDNPRVGLAIKRAMDFWLDLGVDGLRLDAVPYLYERDGTDCENLPETHAFLRELRRHVDERYGDRMLLAEANQWPEEAVTYFGNGDECHMAFNFPVMPRMFMAIRMEDRLPITDIIEQTPPIPDGAQWALFLRNHDELTLEMVTDEERDYMYRVYAGDPQARVNLGIRRRLAPLLGNHRRRIELMKGLLLSLPGTPVLYYGDEIGLGDNVHLGDRDSVRTPMQWTGDRNAGFSTADPAQLYLPVVTDPENHFEAVNVAVEQANPHSLLWWMKRVVALRKRHPAFGRGSMELLHPENRHILAFLRRYGDETILVVANLSRFFQPVELALQEFEGSQPVEMFGRIEFPVVGGSPYPLSLAPHAFMWLMLESVAAKADASGGAPALAVLPATNVLRPAIGTAEAARLAEVLAEWARNRSWYRSRGRRVLVAEIVDRIDLPARLGAATVVGLRVNYTDGEPDTYLIPLTTATLLHHSLVFADGRSHRAEEPGLRIAALSSSGDGPSDFLVDAAADEGFAARLVDAIVRRRRLSSGHGALVGRPGPSLRGSAGRETILTAETAAADEATPAGMDGKAAVLQFRHFVEIGPDPATEVIHFLTAHGAVWVAPILGELAYRPASGQSGVVALLRAAMPHDGNVEDLMRNSFLGYLELAAAAPSPAPGPLPSPAPEAGTLSLTAADMLRAAATDPTAGGEAPWSTGHAADFLGSYLDTARAIGDRVGEVHLLLASEPNDPIFAPEPFTRLYQRSLHKSIEGLAMRAYRLLSNRTSGLEEASLADAQQVLALRGRLTDRLGTLRAGKLGGARIRIPGALCLDRVMQTEHGRVMLDLDGDTGRPASERRLKRSPLRDVVAMLQSFHDVALGRLREADVGGSLRQEDAAALDVWARHWYLLVSAAFLRGYRGTTGRASFLPGEEAEWVSLLDVFLIESALGRLVADMRDESDRLPSSIRGLLEALGG